MSPTRTRSLALLSLTLLGLWLPAADASGADPGERIASLLEGVPADELGAEVAVAARYLPSGEAAPEGRLLAVLQLVVEPRRIEAARSLALTVLVRDEDGDETHRATLDAGAMRGASPWVFLLPIDLPANNRGVAVAIEDAASGAWGGALAEWGGEPIEVASGAAVAEGPTLAPRAAAGPDAAPTEADAPRTITLVPPRGELSGTTRFETIVSDSRVERVDFLVDGEVVASDGRKPFAERLELASPPRRQTVAAVAYDAEGRELGRHELALGGAARRLRVAFAEWNHDVGRGTIEVGVEVEVPDDAALDRVEIFYGELPVATLRRPPFRATLEAPEPGPTDYVRALATLADGRSIDAVELVAARGASERLDVNLVELYTVVTRADGLPVEELAASDFELLEDGRRRPIEGFGRGQDVPLLLGMVIDSSGSMEGIMNETKQAAARFLAQVLRRQDRAFVVDFDTRPRLVQGVTGDLDLLFGSLGSLVPEGFTAFYDSVVFSLLELGSERGRKALVVLTDGDDYRSRYGPRRAIDDARERGVPIYILGLGDPEQLQRTFKGSPLYDVAAKTGGKIFLVSDPVQLGEAYSAIERELRSQYLLTFYTPTGREPGEIEVRIDRPGLDVRTVVGAR